MYHRLMLLLLCSALCSDYAAAGSTIYFLTGYEYDNLNTLYDSETARTIETILGHRGYRLVQDNRTTLRELLEYISDPGTIAIFFNGHSNGVPDENNRFWVYDPASDGYVKVTAEMIEEEIENLPGDYCPSNNLEWITMGTCSSHYSREYYLAALGLTTDQVAYWGWKEPIYLSGALTNMTDNFLTFIQRLPHRNGAIREDEVPEDRREAFAVLEFETADLYTPLLLTVGGKPFGGPELNFQRTREEKLPGFRPQQLLLPLSLFADDGGTVRLFDPYGSTKNKGQELDDYLLRGLTLRCLQSEKVLHVRNGTFHFGDNSLEKVHKDLASGEWKGAHRVLADWTELSGAELTFTYTYRGQCG
ncbi:MAG: hypothetical protein A2284_09920 [Deltaproteobacteria bacterium RIFOXYA12_FULL_61_11]|nr:MAG: hypothetical protein A2284_09920 [Deltaproteobacteria bacterium RIFOXYA12_FULL_61_11]